VAALSHTSNTDLWGRTGLFVGGVSIADPAAAQEALVKEVGPGRRLPDSMGPVVVLRVGKPVLAMSAVGAGLHGKTVQVLDDVLEFGIDAADAADGPCPLPRTATGATRLIEGAYPADVVSGLERRGMPVEFLRTADVAEWGRWRGRLVGVAADPRTGAHRGFPARRSPAVER
jgi:gamma-glutamyltranspeptidase/glutathione hydrolase